MLLLDLDGTLREPLSGQQYFQHPQDQRLIAGVEVAIGTYPADWLMVGITNQGGVAAGHKTIQQCIQEQQYTLQLLPQLKEIYFCPDFQGRKCFRVTRHNVHNHSKSKWSGHYRKPGAGMLQLAIARHQELPANCLYVGDRPEDEQAARRANVAFQWAWEWTEHHQQSSALRA